MTELINTREIVLDMLSEVLEGEKYSHTVLSHTLKKYQQLDKQDRAFISRLFTGTVKLYITLDYMIDQFSTIPSTKMKPFIRNLLRLSVYQLMYMDKVPASAVCNEAVKLSKKRGFVKLSGFVNAVLRNISRKKAELQFPDKSKEPVKYLMIAYSTPQWLVSKLLSQYSFDTVESILEASLKEKEVTIRCNKGMVSPEQLKEMLKEEGVAVTQSDYLNYAFIIKDYDYLERLSTFQKGYFAVQDVSSMLVCEAADLRETDYVVDVCAAPGGKALHAAEKAKLVLARDISEYKKNLIDENIRRMGFTNVITKVWNATEPDHDLFGYADVVIADLPCSGLGVIGKKSDIKYKLTQNQHKELIELQRIILKTVQNYVKTGGILIFSTCTIDREENLENFKWFIDNFDFEPVSLDSSLPTQLINETTKQGYLQLLQGVQHTDGFFLSKFRKK